MEIAPYTIQDAGSVAAFFREIFAELGWTERPSDFMDQPHRLFHIPGGGLLLVVKQNNEIIGTAGIIMLSSSEGLIKRFYIKKTFRGTGIATTLLDKLLIEVKQLGVKKIVLDVSKDNVRAIRFYEKNGFIPTSILPQEEWPESHMPDSHLFFYKNT